MPDVITIGIYRKEDMIALQSEEGCFAIKDGFTSAIRDMLNIKRKFDAAAKKRGKTPPKLYISFLLIPDWGANRKENREPCRHYDSSSYIENKEKYLSILREKFNELYISPDIHDNRGYAIIDCLDDGILTDVEKAYMENLTALGSNADIIKTRAMIARRHCNHLQLDSNTKIYSYQALYDDIFGCDNQEAAYHVDAKASHDIDDVEMPEAHLDGAFNASHYDEDYVSVHNKIVYLPKDSNFVDQLQLAYYGYCDKVNMETCDEKTRLKTKNAIYSKVFTVAAAAVGIASPYEVELGNGITRTIYPAKLSEKHAFRLTRHVVTAVNQSWKPGQIHPLGFDDAKKLDGVEFGDTTFDFACYNIVKKKLLTGTLTKHPIGSNKVFDTDKARAQLHDISNIENERECVLRFEEQAIDCIYRLNGKSLRGAVLEIIFSRWDDGEARVLRRILSRNLPASEQCQLLSCFYDGHEPEYRKTNEAVATLCCQPHDIQFDMLFLRVITQSHFSVPRKAAMIKVIKDSKLKNIEKWRITKEHKRLRGDKQPLHFEKGFLPKDKGIADGDDPDKSKASARGATQIPINKSG